MSFQDITSEWLAPDEWRPWPPVASIQHSLGKLGLSLEDVHLNPLGARTAEIVGVKEHSENRFCLTRQRDPNPRIVCPLEEEYEALRQMHALCPGLVPEPIGVIKPNNGEPFLLLHWVDGVRLGSRLEVRENPEEVATAIALALSKFHTAGRWCDLSGLTRQVRVDRLLDAAQNSPLRGVVVASPSWGRAIAALRALTDGLAAPTLLHGDAHAYNLMETPDGPCWVDFERLATGPPEIDNARTWVLLQAQARREVVSPWNSDAQFACDFLAATNFLEASPSVFDKEARSAVEAALRTVIRRLL